MSGTKQPQTVQDRLKPLVLTVPLYRTDALRERYMQLVTNGESAWASPEWPHEYPGEFVDHE